MGDFFNFIDQKSMAYHHIDTLRMGRIWQKIASSFPTIPPTIHVIGTNGKGTTGRFIANALLNKGIKVGHYTSPHIQSFNERIWIDGKNVSHDMLQEGHELLGTLLDDQDQDELSYFEYTTLLAMVVFKECDWVVLEAGLGGEFDATTVFPNKKLLVVTPIGIDHIDFLGESIDDIATTKLNAMKSLTFVGFQNDPVVHHIAQEIGLSRGFEVASVQESRFDEVYTQVGVWGEKKALPTFLVQNGTTALCALSILGFQCDVSDLKLDLQGRMQRLSPNCVVDVGHNELAARVVSSQLSSLFSTPPVLVYNCFSDKDPSKILMQFSPYIKGVSILPLENERLIDQEVLKNVIEKSGIEIVDFGQWDQDENLCVFGSFSVVEEFLKKGYDAR
jgi:dihydrofolate synthase/folylpolyglutamate synthase